MIIINNKFKHTLNGNELDWLNNFELEKTINKKQSTENYTIEYEQQNAKIKMEKTLVELNFSNKRPRMELSILVNTQPLRVGDVIKVPYSYFCRLSPKIGKNTDKSSYITFLVKETFLILADNSFKDNEGMRCENNDPDNHPHQWRTELDIIFNEENYHLKDLFSEIITSKVINKRNY
jgi:hypothetical protein